jgi:hypothetical protein
MGLDYSHAGMRPMGLARAGEAIGTLQKRRDIARTTYELVWLETHNGRSSLGNPPKI